MLDDEVCRKHVGGPDGSPGLLWRPHCGKISGFAASPSRSAAENDLVLRATRHTPVVGALERVTVDTGGWVESPIPLGERRVVCTG